MDKLLVASRIHSERTSPPLQASGFWIQFMQLGLCIGLVHSLPSLLNDGRRGVQGPEPPLPHRLARSVGGGHRCDGHREPAGHRRRQPRILELLRLLQPVQCSKVSNKEACTVTYSHATLPTCIEIRAARVRAGTSWRPARSQPSARRRRCTCSP